MPKQAWSNAYTFAASTVQQILQHLAGARVSRFRGADPLRVSYSCPSYGSTFVNLGPDIPPSSHNSIYNPRQPPPRKHSHAIRIVREHASFLRTLFGPTIFCRGLSPGGPHA